MKCLKILTFAYLSLFIGTRALASGVVFSPELGYSFAKFTTTDKNLTNGNIRGAIWGLRLGYFFSIFEVGYGYNKYSADFKKEGSNPTESVDITSEANASLPVSVDSATQNRTYDYEKVSTKIHGPYVGMNLGAFRLFFQYFTGLDTEVRASVRTTTFVDVTAPFPDVNSTGSGTINAELEGKGYALNIGYRIYKYTYLNYQYQKLEFSKATSSGTITEVSGSNTISVPVNTVQNLNNSYSRSHVFMIAVTIPFSNLFGGDDYDDYDLDY